MTGEPAELVRQIAVKVAALAQNGLTFCQEPYDLDRYRQLMGLSAELLAVISDQPAAELALQLGRDSGYATPKVDVRAAVFDEQDRVLLMRERSDGLWSLPGGWADPLDAPSEAVAREALEETGYRVQVIKLYALWDRDLRQHEPPLPVHVYKMFFLCRLAEGATHTEPSPLETLDVGWFGVHALPELSTGRVHDWQIRRGLAHRHDPALPTDFD